MNDQYYFLLKSHYDGSFADHVRAVVKVVNELNSLFDVPTEKATIAVEGETFEVETDPELIHALKTFHRPVKKNRQREADG